MPPKNFEFIDILISRYTLVATSIILLLLGVAPMVVPAQALDIQIAFLIFLPLVVLQLTWLIKRNDFVNRIFEAKLSSINSKLFSNNVTFEGKTHAENKIKSLVDSNGVSKVQIICYGPGYFGNVIRFIRNHNHNDKLSTGLPVKIEVVICSSQPKHIEFDSAFSDKHDLEDAIKYFREDAVNTQAFASKVPPTVRACAVFDLRGQVIYCYYQPYYFYPPSAMQETCHHPHIDKKHMLQALDESSLPVIIADKNDSILEDLYKSFDKEFQRLMACESCKNPC